MEGLLGCHQGYGGASSIDNTTTLCSWGANGYGQLGQGHTEDQLLPVAVTPSYLPRETLSGVSCVGGGGGFSYMLTGAGQLLTCGNNDRGQLGLGDPGGGDGESATGRSPNKEITVFTLCRFLAGVKVAKVSPGWDFLLALSEEGTVYSWGSNSFGQLGRLSEVSGQSKQSNLPAVVHFQGKGCQQDIAAGLRHAISVSTEGHVCAWGHGKRCQLGSEVTGHLRAKSIAVLPQDVPVATLNKVKSVFAGMYHSGALTKSGDIYLWGCNAYGQCGVDPGTSPRVEIPHQVCIAYQDKERTVAVCSGWTHLVAHTDKGHLYSWGRSNLGQLGRSSDKGHDPTPARVEGLAGVTMHSCGSEHNIALTTDSSLYTWGWNEHGICATGDEENVSRPRPVSVFGQNSMVTSVGCGAGHTFCFLSHRS